MIEEGLPTIEETKTIENLIASRTLESEAFKLWNCPRAFLYVKQTHYLGNRSDMKKGHLLHLTQISASTSTNCRTILSTTHHLLIRFDKNYDAFTKNQTIILATNRFKEMNIRFRN